MEDLISKKFVMTTIYKKVVEEKIMPIITITIDKATASNLADSLVLVLSEASKHRNGSDNDESYYTMAGNFIRALKTEINNTKR